MSQAVKISVNKKELFKSSLKSDLKDSISECTVKMDEIGHLRNQLVKSIWPGYDWMTHAMDFYWECENSPFGWCAYEHFEDRAHDHCIFCGDPSERK